MFSYSEGLDKYLSYRRKKIMSKNAKEIERIEILSGKFCSDIIATELTLSIVSSVKRCINEIYERPKSTITFISNLRFLFETCITVRLLVAEESYKYKLRYSIYQQQINKSKSLTEYAQKDLSRLDSIQKEEESLYGNENEIDDDSFQNKVSEIDKLYDSLDEEISIFLDMAEFNGAGYHKTHIHSFLKSHQKREDEIRNEWDEIKKSLLKNEEANRFFDFKGQTSRVEKELKDNRNWKDKAAFVGLEEIYKFIYDYSSSLIHSMSYSILIPNQLELPEINMVIGLSTRITSDILKNLCIFGKIPNMLVLRIDDE
ncbi:hypothetical protein [Brenneria corticis]|uniref:Uncharacterized protein n=1 Tax=Brenneria corticis TaxID=2173106 RepID=A0A2U1TKZ6_9GAMM|nr:hypothetical protein [Brenneria sp. CFCC 11842]PWC10081.1 hypothetical protein DDT56_22645 [Brenneria sp. CFCC 11842]